jgi:hypothetical protein
MHQSLVVGHDCSGGGTANRKVRYVVDALHEHGDAVRAVPEDREESVTG